MMLFEKIVLASGNAGKRREFAAMFEPLGMSLIAQSELGVEEVPEPHPTFIENALVKARHASLCTGLPALADDSGLCVDALGGEPGVHSARFAQADQGLRSDQANNQKLVQLMSGVNHRRASYVALLVLVRRHDDPLPLIAQGVWHGEIVTNPRGEHGFGYDPHFFLTEHGMTAAELPPGLKNQVSHRAMALRTLLDMLREA